jgi:hypothetical protein
VLDCTLYVQLFYDLRKRLGYLGLGWVDWEPERSDIDICGRKYLVTNIQFLYFNLSLRESNSWAPLGRAPHATK